MDESEDSYSGIEEAHHVNENKIEQFQKEEDEKAKSVKNQVSNPSTSKNEFTSSVWQEISDPRSVQKIKHQLNSFSVTFTHVGIT